MTATALPADRSTGTPRLRLTLIGLGVALVGLLMMGLTMLMGTTTDGGDFRYAGDWVITIAALPHGAGLLLATIGVHRLQQGRDGRLGRLGVWIYGACITELVIQCMVGVAAEAEIRWGAAYPLCSLGLFVGLALLAAGSWRVGLLPRWMLGVWPPLGLFGSFLGIGPIPLVFAAFLVALAVVLIDVAGGPSGSGRP